ncbi:MAG: SPFH domain-containing protein [Lachnospiraceae bacterium]|nr:SPFH domain-containing protein [Lachnospiraceae bacterium]
MGLIKAAFSSVSGALKDQFLEAVEPVDMGEHTVFTTGVIKGKNGKASGIISNGSVIHVYDNQFMMIVDGGKVIDYTAEPGYFVIDNSSAPSMFNGQFKDSLADAWNRFKHGGTTPLRQEVYYINLQEIKGIKFGTRNPINYFDSFYNAELFLRTHGTYSIKITNPILFYQEAVPRNAVKVDIDDINEQYLSEFLEALQVSINKMSAEGERISFVASKSSELSRHMAEVLDEQWKNLRGMEIVSVALASISYDEESQKLINMRNQGAMMSDPTIREGFVQSAVASGIQAAGSNTAGAATGFMGVNMGMAAAGGFMGSASQNNIQQMQMQQQQMQQQAAAAAPAAGSWTCECGAVNTGKFCPECGKARPADGPWICQKCGTQNTGKFCAECGSPRA